MGFFALIDAGNIHGPNLAVHSTLVVHSTDGYQFWQLSVMIPRFDLEAALTWHDMTNPSVLQSHLEEKK